MTSTNDAEAVAAHLNRNQRKALRRIGRGQSVNRSMMADPFIRRCYSTDHYPDQPRGDDLNVVTWCDYEDALRSSNPRLTDFGQGVLNAINQKEKP